MQNIVGSEDKMKTRELTKYDKQAQEFTEKTGLKIYKGYCGHYKRFEDAKYISSQWRIKFSRKGKKEFWFDFSQSCHNSFSKTEMSGFRKKPLDVKDFHYLAVKETLETGATEHSLPFTLHWDRTPPSDYDILTCLTKYDIGTFEDFCGEFGYSEDSRKTEKTYFAVQKEYQDLRGMFSEAELVLMAEIQ